MTKKTFVFVLLLIVLIPQVLALSSEIKVKTLPYHQVQLTTFDQDASSFTAFERFKQEADQYGDTTFIFTSDEPDFGIIIYIKWSGETVVSKKYEESYETGKPVYLEIAPAGARLLKTPDAVINETNSTEIPENETQTEEIPADNSTTEEEVNDNQNSITGFTITEELSKETKKTIYIVLISVVALAIILIFIFKFRNKSRKLIGMDFKPSSASKQPDARLITNLERKLKDAEHEITLLKNREKIKEVERRIEEEKKEIERLRSGF